MTDGNLKNGKVEALDGLRTISCLGIILMHMRANNNYHINGFLYNTIIPSFTDFVYIFMILSAFGLCCGYYKKVQDGTINWTNFYAKRYLKILPFFSLLCLFDLLISFSKESLFEAIANITLTHGLYPNDIQVIGVGWFLGLIFAFYMMFPFFCVLIGTKKRAWFFFAVSLVINFLCKYYFNVGRTNIMYSFCFFIAGGLIYLYKDFLANCKWFIILLLLVVSIISYYLLDGYPIIILLISTLAVVFAMGRGGRVIFDNKPGHFISSISLEMYLSHMVIFRIVEKLHLNSLFENDILQYIFTCIIVISLDIVVSYTCQKIISIIINKISSKLQRV